METEDKSQPPPHPKKLKYLTTCAILLGNATFGCAFNFYNPAVEEFRVKYDTNVDDVSTVFTVMLVSYCMGALSSGIIYNFINRQLGVIFCLGGMAFALYLTPHCESKTLFFVTGGILGYFVGAYDASQVVWIIEIWQEKSGPFIQAQHLCYAIGSNIPSLLLAPFLTAEEEDEEPSINNSTTTAAPAEELSSELWIPFTVGGAFSTLAFLFQLFLFVFVRYYVPPLYQTQNQGKLTVENNEDFEVKSSEELPSVDSKTQLATLHEEGEKEAEVPTRRVFGIDVNIPKLKLIILTGCFLGAYQGMEMCTMQFLTTYGQYSSLAMKKSDAAYVLTGLTGAFAIGRLFGVFIILKVPPVPLLYGNLLLVTGGNLILLLWAKDDLTMFWTAAILIGAGFSTIFASFSGFMENNIIFTNAIGSFMIVCGSTVAAIYPVIVGGNIEEHVETLSYTNFFSIFVCTVALTVGYFLTRNSKIRY